MIIAEVGLDELGTTDDEDVIAGDDENTSGPVDELEIVEWVFQEKLWHDSYLGLDLVRMWLEKLGRDLAGSLGGCPTLEANVVKQKAFEEVSS